MKRIIQYAPLHFLLCLILGISIQFTTRFWSFGVENLVYILLFLLLMLLINHKILRTLASFLLFFWVGVTSVFIHNHQNFENYYTHHLTNDVTAILQIEKVLKPGNYYDKFEAKVYQIDNTKTIGRVLLNIKKDSIKNTLDVDDFIVLKPEFKALIPPLNPHQFDYKAYLEKKAIYQQIFVSSDSYQVVKNDAFNVYGLSAKLRYKIQTVLKSYNFSKDEFGVINALLLGQRQDISKELIDDYSKAGAIHILAVSGLHVGIILLILSWLLTPLEFLKNGKVLKTVLIILLLWCFAFIAGLSASVVRAVTMFSFVAFGMFFSRKNVVEFSLISSMLFLLIVKPMFLFDVGFQLSYLAVFGIVWVQPKLYQLWQPKHKIVNFFWRLFTVSIAAQVGILPLSIYYFNQFPGLFLLSNLIIIPFLGAILIGGILCIALALLHILPQFLADIYGAIIATMNTFVQWISHQEAFLFQGLSLPFLMMLALYILIFSFIVAAFKVTPKKILLFLIAVVVIQSVFLFEQYQQQNTKEFIVFHKSRHSVIGNRVGAKVFIKQDSLTNSLKLLDVYKIGAQIDFNYTKKQPNVLMLQNQQILVVDSLGIYQLNELKHPIVVIQYSPKLNMERLIKTINPKQIVVDGSNYKSYVNSWKSACNKMNVPFHYTGENGAFIYSY